MAGWARNIHVRMDGCLDEEGRDAGIWKVDGRMDGWADGCLDEEGGMEEYDRSMDAWMPGCMDEEGGWMDEILEDNLE